MSEESIVHPVSQFWKDPETVDTFANRDADRRLVQLLDKYTEPGKVRILDLGCAGGRNTVLLASKGFDFIALDGSMPMAQRTRSRVAEICGEAAASERVRPGIMEDLSEFADESFQLIAALGIYHQAQSLDHWHECVSESARVLREGGLVLISAFTPDSQPDGKPLEPIPKMPSMYGGFSSGPLCLFNSAKHDEVMASLVFDAPVPTETVQVETELGFRYTMNALYRKYSPSSDG